MHCRVGDGFVVMSIVGWYCTVATVRQGNMSQSQLAGPGHRAAVVVEISVTPAERKAPHRRMAGQCERNFASNSSKEIVP